MLKKIRQDRHVQRNMVAVAAVLAAAVIAGPAYPWVVAALGLVVAVTATTSVVMAVRTP